VTNPAQRTPVRPIPTLRPAGVKIAGSGSALPSKSLSNKDLESMMETSDEWIVQRTGIRQRMIIDKSKGECTKSLATAALNAALADARIPASELDMLIVATMTAEMDCPATSAVVAKLLGAKNCGAMDINAACSGFVYTLNTAHELIRGGAYRTIGIVGADTLSELMDYSTAGRGTAIIFGDAAGAMILRACDDPTRGILAQSLHSDGEGWKEIYVPNDLTRDFPSTCTPDPSKLGRVQMNGAGVFKFAVTTFPNLIAETLDKAGLKAHDIDMFVCHQSNRRILEAARERFGVPEDRLYINIDRVGNTVAASVPLCFDEARRAGKIHDGDRVMFLAFGGGLTWASSLWQL
jgi:3-oxoacyl-[acyl-carrier-protein] synthase-3